MLFNLYHIYIQRVFFDYVFLRQLRLFNIWYIWQPDYPQIIISHQIWNKNCKVVLLNKQKKK